MLLEKERELVAAYGRRLVPAGLTAGTGGNLSVRDPVSGAVAVSPSGMEYDAISPADVTVLAPDGTVLDGERKPTSEAAMHLAFYAGRTGTPWCTPIPPRPRPWPVCAGRCRP